MAWFQETITLPPFPRGFHLITERVQTAVDLGPIRTGLLHLFICHTSASLTLNENASPEVRGDFERHLNQMISEAAPYYRHTLEGPDDMPAHLKASLLGHALSIPVGEGQLLLGTWQGIYLGEHRDRGGPRTLVITVHGECSP